jgi:hypothetical protein
MSSAQDGSFRAESVTKIYERGVRANDRITPRSVRTHTGHGGPRIRAGAGTYGGQRHSAAGPSPVRAAWPVSSAGLI